MNTRGEAIKVFLNVPLLNQWLERLNWQKNDLALKTDLSQRTIIRVFKLGEVSVNVHKALIEAIANEISTKRLTFVAPKSLSLSQKSKKKKTNMFVAVRLNNIETKHVRVPVSGNISDEDKRDKARKIAFRLVHKRREADFNELMHHTHFIEVQECSQDVAEVLLELR